VVGMARRNLASTPQSNAQGTVDLSGNERARVQATDHQYAPAYAALDLGTNNCRLLIAQPTRRGFQVVDAFSRIIRLGEGVSNSGMLSEAAMSRTLEALKICAAKMERYNVVRSRLVATEACRIAKNGAHFVERVKQDLGMDIEILTRELEAQLAVSGCTPLIDEKCDHALVFDIGGGSSELVWLDLSKRRSNWRRSLADRLEATSCISAWTSLPTGVVTLAEGFGGYHVDNPTFQKMVQHVQELMEPFEAKHQFCQRIANGSAHFLGTSGTVTTVAGIQLKLKRYDRNRIDGCWLASQDVRSVTQRLLNQTYDQRVANPCIGRDRADLVLAGCAILEALLRTWPANRLRVADRGLREGILTIMMAEDAQERRKQQKS